MNQLKKQNKNQKEKIIFILVMAAMLASGFLLSDVSKTEAASVNRSAGPYDQNTNVGVKLGNAGYTWRNLKNASGSDNLYATVISDAIWASGIVYASNFDFNIPSTATITGVEVFIERTVDYDYTDTCVNPRTGEIKYYSSVTDKNVQLFYNGDVPFGEDKATSTKYIAADTVAIYGGLNDLWNLNLTPADVNDSGFGVRFRADKDGFGCGRIIIGLDSIKMKIYYTVEKPETSITSPNDGDHIKATTAINAIASDIAGISKIELWYSGPATSTKLGEMASATYNFNWDTSALADGSYTLWSDAYNNIGEHSTSSEVNVVIDNTKPTITLTGDASISITAGGTYTEAGATCSDAIDGSSAVVISGAVDNNTAGIYQVKYNCADQAGNNATEVIRTITVKKKTSGGGGGGFGSGSGGVAICSKVVYGEWGSCVNNSQYRDLVYPSDGECRLTDEQETARTRTCSEPVQEVLGVKIFPDGTLLRIIGDPRIYVVENGEWRHIKSIQELREKYAGQEILNIRPDGTIVLGYKMYADGTLLRFKDEPKIWVVENGEWRHIKSLAELQQKHPGQEILNID